MNTERLETVLARTGTFPNFYMTSWKHCLQAVTKDCFPNTKHYENWQFALFFEMSETQLMQMFKPPYEIADKATRVDAVNMLTHLIKTGEVNWNPN